MTADNQAAPAARGPRIEPLTRLATGGMAEIWLARELGAAGLERLVVVKRLLPHLARDPDIVDMFVSEARFVARLVHPNVVQIHELAEDEQGYFLVMEYVEGCSVRELMVAANRAGELLPPEVGICIVEQACRGAHAAHELTDSAGQPLGLVHRDISPHNLMIGPGGDVKLLDFGIAKATEAAGGTHTGSLKGKCSYMSPEQCRAHRLDRRTDVFSLGIVLWELLVGKRLFQRDAEYASMEAIVTGDYELPTKVRPDLPPALDAVIAKALATRVARRYQTADDMRRALIAAADEAGLRPSRDGIAATLASLLGTRLEQREQALRRAALDADSADPALLRDALIPSDPSMQPSYSDVSVRSAARADGAEHTGRTGSDDILTVVQRRSTRPPPNEPRETTQTSPRSAEDVTLVDERKAAPAPNEPPLASAVAAQTAEAEPSQGAAVQHDAAIEPQMSPRRSGVKWLIAGALLVVVALVVGVFVLDEPAETKVADAPDAGAPDAATVLSGPPLRLAVAPTVDSDVMREELAPFNRWLGEQLDRPVELLIADSYQHSAELVTAGRVDLGLLPPLLFVQTLAREPRIHPLVLRLYEGSRASDGYLLVRDEDTLADAAGLRGKTICMVDRESTTGFLLPRIWLRKADLDPDRDVRTRLSGDHISAMRELVDGKCDAAAVYSGAHQSAPKQGISVGKMRIFGITGRVPQDVIAGAPHLTEADVDKLRSTLIRFQPQRDIGQARVGSVLGISGFAPFDATEFDLIREAAEKEGIVAKDEPPP